MKIFLEHTCGTTEMDFFKNALFNLVSSMIQESPKAETSVLKVGAKLKKFGIRIRGLKKRIEEFNEFKVEKDIVHRVVISTPQEHPNTNIPIAEEPDKNKIQNGEKQFKNLKKENKKLAIENKGLQKYALQLLEIKEKDRKKYYYENRSEELYIDVWVDSSQKSVVKIIENKDELYKLLCLSNNERVLRITGVFEKDNKFHVVSERMEGNVKELVEINIFKIPQKYDILLKMSKCVEVLHKEEFLHNDIKPANFVYSNDGKKILIADFGSISHPYSNKFYTRTKKDITSMFAAPEVLSEDLYSKKSDVYSLGISFWYILTEEPRIFGHERTIEEKIKNNKLKPDLKELDTIPKFQELLKFMWDEKDKRYTIEKVIEWLEKNKDQICKEYKELIFPPHNEHSVRMKEKKKQIKKIRDE